MENYRNNLQDQRLSNIEKSVGVINTEMGAVKADIKWLKWYAKLIITSQIAIILALLKLIFS